MDNDRDQEPIELQKDFVQSLDTLARLDEEGKLDCISHEQLMAELDVLLCSAKDNKSAFEANNPEYAESPIPRVQR